MKRLDKCFILLILGFIALCASVSHAALQEWGISEGWHCDDPFANPANSWAYGYKNKADGPTGTFVLYDWATCGGEPDPTYSYWTTSSPWAAGGYVHKNTSSTEPFAPGWGYWEPLQVTAWPNPAKSSVFRWTAPIDGEFNLSVK